MADPVSWLLVEEGWTVVGADGEKLGSVEDVIGDPDRDIFSGLAVRSGLLGKVHYVPAERVRQILEGSIELDVDRRGLEELDEHEPGAALT